jgi:hypothetical protein
VKRFEKGPSTGPFTSATGVIDVFPVGTVDIGIVNGGADLGFVISTGDPTSPFYANANAPSALGALVTVPLPTLTQLSTSFRDIPGHACAIRDQGTPAVICWGDNADGEVGIDSGGLPVASPQTVAVPAPSRVCAGVGFSCSVAQGTGVVRCWGTNAQGELGAMGPGGPTPQIVSLGGSSATDVVCGESHACALAVGEVWCWGANYAGQTGTGARSVAELPHKVTFPETTMVSVSTTYEHACAVSSSGKVYCWGSSARGQIGNGKSANYPAPVTPVIGLP